MTHVYIGTCRDGTWEIFKSEATPTEFTHGPRAFHFVYRSVIGPFRTMRGATFMRDHGRNNPHCQCVEDAERLSIRNPSPL